MAKLVKDQLCQDKQISIMSYTGSKLHRGMSSDETNSKKCC